MTNHECALLVGDTVALLQWVATSKGEPRHIKNQPGCFNAKWWAHNQKLFTAESISRNTFRFYVTPEGVRFLQENGVATDTITDVRPFKAETSPEPVEVTSVFAQTGNGPIQQVELAAVPGYVLDTLREGMVAVADGKLYGLSHEHILGTD